ncbi:MAG: 4Fe-4S binding protein [Firmicutes bacterium]|jgi:formate hydrogenlyase subunit 6/NADH:ubiquinone oxidoreductase subunit I|nr:4Fe-4S binding protein [Bacillota bacterium]
MIKNAPGIITNMAVKHLFKKPATISYPRGELHIVDNYRGKLSYDPTECNGCRICMRYCPSGAIKVVNVGTKEEKEIEVSLEISRCIFCCQCVDSCPRNCLSYTQEIDLSTMNKDDLTVQL